MGENSDADLQGNQALYVDDIPGNMPPPPPPFPAKSCSTNNNIDSSKEAPLPPLSHSPSLSQATGAGDVQQSVPSASTSGQSHFLPIVLEDHLQTP